MHFDELFAWFILRNELHRMLKLQHDTSNLHLDFFVNVNMCFCAYYIWRNFCEEKDKLLNLDCTMNVILLFFSIHIFWHFVWTILKDTCFSNWCLNACFKGIYICIRPFSICFFSKKISLDHVNSTSAIELIKYISC